MKNITVCLLFLVAFSATAISQSFKNNELLMQVKAGASIKALSEKLVELGGVELRFLESISAPMRIYHLQYAEDVDLDQIIRNSYQISEIEVIQKNHLIENRVTIPNDSNFGDQWHLNNTGQSGGNPDADIDAPEAWDITTGGNTSHGDTIVVCVIENQGIDINHEDLAANMWKNYHEIPGNGIDDDNNGYIDDYNGWNVGNNTGFIGAGGHGTKVAGMIGAIGNNGIGISGVNHTVKMMVVQGQAANNEASVIAAYTYPLVMRKKYNESNGLEGAFVVATNASWGSNGNAASAPLWCGFYDSLGVHGIINIGATTNSSINVDIQGDLPTSCPSDYMVAVTRTNSSDFRSGGFGPIHIDLGAPGTDLLLTNSNNSYQSGQQGTSFAAPAVTGAVALLYAAPCTDFISYAKTYPDSAALKIRALLLDNVDNISNLAAQVSSGGRLNINNSLEALVNTCSTNPCFTPYGISAENISDTAFVMQWQNNGNSSFIINYGLAGSSLSNQIMVQGGNSSTQVISGLIPCTFYEFSIAGLCGTDSSEISPTFLVRTDGCCENPILVADTTTETTIELSWSPILYATNYVIRYQAPGANSWTYDTVSAPLHSISGLDTCTDYNVQVKTICGDSSRAYSQTSIITTKGCGICFEGYYCDINPQAVNSQFEWLESFSIDGVISETGNNLGYFNGGTFGSGLKPGGNYTVVFTPGYAGLGAFTEFYRVWIDMDQNGIFESSEALISNISGTNTVLGMLSIPSTTEFGVTKMRIAMTSAANATICADQGGLIYGEYEDYCIYIGENASVANYKMTTPKLFPNPTTDLVTIATEENIDQVTIFDLSGKMVMNIEKPSNNQISMQRFTPGIYMISIVIDGAISQQKLIKQ